jgi:4-amino-4-deoxy-L-arabinose transferase-like glycosyltransferase
MQWMLLVWLVIRWHQVRDDRLLIALGVLIGIAAMTKFLVMLLGLVLLVAVAICGPRDVLRRPLLWAGAALAVVIAMPTLIWQHLQGWPPG